MALCPSCSGSCLLPSITTFQRRDGSTPAGQRAGQPRDKIQTTLSAPFTGALALTPGQSVTYGIAIDSSFDFLAFELNITATLTDNVTFIAQLPATILLTTTSSGTRLMDQAQHVENLRGNGAWPGILPWPLWLPGSGTLQVQLTSLDTVDTYNVFVSFPGIAVY